MDSLLKLLMQASDFLAGKGVEHPRLNAELIFAHILECRRLDLYLRFECPIGETQKEVLRTRLVRRGQREPLQYVLGETHFYNLDLKCDVRGLIPRPETEELVERLESLLSVCAPKSILDMGTGSGCLGLALASVFPKAYVTLVDQSPEALSLAVENARCHGLLDRLVTLQSNWFTALQGRSYDLIVSNPPYLTLSEWESAAPEVRCHEPRAALVGEGVDGADYLRQIITAAPDYLNAGGVLALETGIHQHASLEKAVQAGGLIDFCSEKDLSGRPRFVFAKSRGF